MRHLETFRAPPTYPSWLIHPSMEQPPSLTLYDKDLSRIKAFDHIASINYGSIFNRANPGGYSSWQNEAPDLPTLQTSLPPPWTPPTAYPNSWVLLPICTPRPKIGSDLRTEGIKIRMRNHISVHAAHPMLDVIFWSAIRAPSTSLTTPVAGDGSVTQESEPRNFNAAAIEPISWGLPDTRSTPAESIEHQGQLSEY